MIGIFILGLLFGVITGAFLVIIVKSSDSDVTPFIPSKSERYGAVKPDKRPPAPPPPPPCRTIKETLF